jgi:hypothetical protein
VQRISDLQSLVYEISLRHSNIIVIDGYPGTGKSTIALIISKLLDVSLISIDSFLTQNQGTYVPSIQYELLKKALQNKPLIIEGICSLEVLSRINENYDILIYITASVKITNQNIKIAKEVDDYHERWQPDQRADVYFDNNEPLDLLRGTMPTDRTAIDIAYIKAKTQFAIVLACGGILSLFVGLTVLLNGVKGQDETVVKIGDFNLSAKGLGAVIMGTSTVWAFFAYQSRPKYSHSRELTEEIDPESNRTYRREVESSTMIGADDR